MAPIGNLPCGLFYPEKHLVLGGRDVGFPANLRTEFVMFPGDSVMRPYVALSMFFPRALID